MSISTTTRPIRKGEKQGLDYFFVSEQEFKKGIEKGEFLEYAKVHDNWYGTSKTYVENTLKSGKSIIFDIDVQGNEIIKKAYPNITKSVFVTTKDIEILEQRLRQRDTETNETISLRLKNAKKEMTKITDYDYLIVNENFQEALQELSSLALLFNDKNDKIALLNFTNQWNKDKQ